MDNGNYVKRWGRNMTEKLYYKYWGKASSDNESGVGYHLLPYHCLDVATVANQLWLHSSSLRRQFNWGMVKK